MFLVDSESNNKEEVKHGNPPGYTPWYKYMRLLDANHRGALSTRLDMAIFYGGATCLTVFTFCFEMKRKRNVWQARDSLLLKRFSSAS